MNTHKYLYVGLSTVFAAIVLVGGFYLYLEWQYDKFSLTPEGKNAVAAERIDDAYSTVNYQQSVAPQEQDYHKSLQEFRDIAADQSLSNLQRSHALNGINYAYTESVFDASALANVVFSSPPFSAYYTPPNPAAADPLHPESGPAVQAVEKALVELNKLSNALSPNHYAITRMEVAEIFNFQRKTASDPSKRQEYASATAETIQSLIAAYDALPPLDTAGYELPMRMQILFAHASAEAFVGFTLNDELYLDRGEADFAADIKLGEQFPKDSADYKAVHNKELLARIFYTSYYWKKYYLNDPEKVLAVIRPLVTANDPTIFTYLQGHKTSTVAPFSVLRQVSAKLPELKTYLESAGWVFNP